MHESGFPGEPPGQRMRKRQRSNPRVTCGSCRRFDGLAWCRRWNFHTTPDGPICDQYRPLGGDPAPDHEPLREE